MASRVKMFWQVNRWKLLGLIMIFIGTYAVGLQSIESPGVYYDAVYPDYLAAIGAFPSIDNFTQITQHVGLPLLGNFYHGTMTAAVQFLVLKCVGQATVYTLRLTNLFYIAVIGSILFLFTQKVGKKYAVPLIGSLLCVTSQNAIAFTRTQYYIMLPGVIFFLLSVYLLLSVFLLHEENVESKLLLSGVFQGIAFYDYFTFLFLAPASVAIIAYHAKTRQKISSMLIYLWGIMLGSILYFFGYYDSLLVNIFGVSNVTRLLLIIGCMAMSFVFILPVIIMMVPKYKKYLRALVKLYLGIVGVAAAVGVVIVVGAIFLIPEKMKAVSNLLTLSQNRNSGSRFTLFWTILYQQLSNYSSQWEIFSEYIDDWGYVYILLCVILTVVAAVHYCVCGERKDKITNGRYLFHIWIYVFGFYLSSLPIVTGMQPQHFVVMYFVMFLLLTFGVLYLTLFINMYAKCLTVLAFFLLGLVLNAYNNRLFFQKLGEIGGRGYFSLSYNELANSAYADEQKENKVYVFPEWGFNANFIYLTSNTCKTIRDADIDIEELQQKINDGYIVIIVARNERTIGELKQQLSYRLENEKQWLSGEGAKDFVSVELSNEESISFLQ